MRAVIAAPREIPTDCFRQRRGLLDEQAVKRDGGENAGDGDGGGSVAVGVLHAGETVAELGVEGALDGSANGRGFRIRVEHVAGALAALLAHAHVDHRQRKGGGFHDAAGGVADQRIRMAEQAPVSDRVEVNEDVRLGARCREGLGAFDERMAAGVGVGIDEDELTGGLGKRGEEGIGLGIGVAKDGDRVPGGDESGRREREAEAGFERCAVREAWSGAGGRARARRRDERATALRPWR